MSDTSATKCQTIDFDNPLGKLHLKKIHWLLKIRTSERLIYPRDNVGFVADRCQTNTDKMSEGMHMVEYISMKNGNKRTLRGVDRNMMDWMRYHTIQDLRDLAFEMYNRGEDISEMVQLIHEMDGMAHVTNMTNDNRVYDFAEYDILSYVEECEKSYV